MLLEFGLGLADCSSLHTECCMNREQGHTEEGLLVWMGSCLFNRAVCWCGPHTHSLLGSGHGVAVPSCGLGFMHKGGGML